MNAQARSVAELLAGAERSDVPRAGARPDAHAALITGVCMDSRRIREGDAFLAVPGRATDGRRFVADAVDRGAAAVIVDGEPTAADRAAARSVPVFGCEDLGASAGRLAGAWHDHPSRALRVLGVTGTNGKTSCTHHLADLLHACGERTALAGTLGNGFPGRLRGTGLTTADAVTLQYSLAWMRDAGARWVAMEVSSHALDQQRTAGIRFAGALLTNLTRDHLDYHGSMDAYGEAKRQLFLAEGLEVGVLNRDDPFARALAERIPAPVELHDYSIDDDRASLHVRDVRTTTGGLRARVESRWGSGDLVSPLLGRFALSNLLGCITLLAGLGRPLDALLEAARHAAAPPGRMQAFAHPHGFTIVVDYAHSPDALGRALEVLREHFPGALTCIFGCGGERDAGKRPLMAAAAAAGADRVVVTDDNPRREDGDAIVADIVAGLPAEPAPIVERDRRRAIEAACADARPGDVLLLAGKGHEDYQDGPGGRTHYSDLETVASIVAAARPPERDALRA